MESRLGAVESGGRLGTVDIKESSVGNGWNSRVLSPVRGNQCDIFVWD